MPESTIRSISNEDDLSVVVGPTFTGFLEQVAPVASKETLFRDATAILTESNVTVDHLTRRTGLVVGRVQSGKTLSYEAVIALARDNGFALVVVISGISNPLLDQGVRRLKADLTRADENGWTFLVNPAADAQTESTLRSIRENWDDPNTPPQLKKTAVCLLLKHHGRIDSFKELCARVGWAGQKVLVVDDEADQASLNISFRRGRESTTYRNILALRATFPHHAYLQYTATPQAPLLIAINDALSPDFVRVLEPGEDYVGGQDFFGSDSRLVKVIPEADLAMASDPNGPPPPTLLEALREFVVGAADVLASGRTEIRSMLVHPSRLTTPHATFLRWTKTVVDFWKAAIDDAEESASLKSVFSRSWESLRTTTPTLADFETCWVNIRFVLRNLQLIEMNSRDAAGTPVVEWDSSRAYVLVGGQALDRGFTVNGLSVTYMSRDPGMWTADTIQQRARFFGYKRHYLGECRVYLEPGLRDAFEMYVLHEQHMIDSLRAIQAGQSSLKAWERQFLLDPSMKATRQSVVSLPMISVSPGDHWVFDPRPAQPHMSSDLAERAIDELWREAEQLEDEFGHPRALVTITDLVRLLEALPSPAAVTLPQTRALRLQLARLIDEHPEERACLIRLRPGVESVRTLTGSGMVQPFQGPAAGYPGDRNVFDPLRLTVQLHRVAVRESKDQPSYASMVIPAVWVPDRLADGWLVSESQQ